MNESASLILAGKQPPTSDQTLGTRLGRSRPARAWVLIATVSFCIAALLNMGCATHRVNDFARFAAAGQASVQATTALTTAAASTAIAADNLAMVNARSAWNEQERKEHLNQHDTELKRRMTLLADLRHHNSLLASYFKALAALAQSNAPSTLGQDAKSLAAALDKCGQAVQLGLPSSAANATQVTTSLLVGRLRSAALEKELRARADLIARELDLELAAVQAITEDMRSDVAALRTEQRLAYEAFFADGELPANWGDVRATLFRFDKRLSAAETALSAARAVKNAFAGLVGQGHSSVDLQVLAGQIEDIAADLK